MPSFRERFALLALVAAALQVWSELTSSLTSGSLAAVGTCRLHHGLLYDESGSTPMRGRQQMPTAVDVHRPHRRAAGFLCDIDVLLGVVQEHGGQHWHV